MRIVRHPANCSPGPNCVSSLHGTWLGLLLCMVGDKCITAVKYWNIEAEIMRTASVIFLGIGFLVLMSLSWVAHNISHGFSNPLLGSMKKTEMGASLCLTSSLPLLLGVLCCLSAAHHAGSASFSLWTLWADG